MEEINTSGENSPPKRGSSPSEASMSSAISDKQKSSMVDDDFDLELNLGQFTDNPSTHNHSKLSIPPPKKRKTIRQTWSISTPGLQDDGYSWRKYGQKGILNSKYHRNYYRCTHRHDQGCLATKYVQQSSDDPPIFNNTYFGRHTCNHLSSMSSSIRDLRLATDENTKKRGMGNVFGQPNEHAQQPGILIGFEQQPDKHTQQHSMTFDEHTHQHSVANDFSSFSSSISYVTQEEQPDKVGSADFVNFLTSDSNMHCVTQPHSLTNPSTKQAYSGMADSTNTTDLAKSVDMDSDMSEVGLIGNHDRSVQKRITPGPVEFVFPLSKRFQVAEEEKFEVERGTTFEHRDLDVDDLRFNVEKEFEMLPQDLKPLTLHCSLFPIKYEFEKDMLIQLWIGGDFLGNVNSKDFENSGNDCFNYLLEKKFVVPSRFDHTCGALKYKINPAVTSVLDKAYTGTEYLVVEDFKLDDISERLKHLSVVCGDLKVGIFDALKKCKFLETLLLLPDCGSTINQVPRSFFLRLRCLRTLDLRQATISELPDSIGNAISLRYIDLSGTPIKWLPESFDRLCNLQTLKLKDCIELIGLPNGMKKLTNLRHLIIDNAHKMISMPSGIGSLTSLRILSTFIVGGHHGCSIEELKMLSHLYGKLCILRLENVPNSVEAMKAAFSDKKNIKKLDLRWDAVRVEKKEEEEEVLQYLQPHFGLKELKVLNYGGLEFPQWVSDSSFVDLVSITFYNCKNCQILPSIGKLPSLKFLCLQKMDNITEINHHLCGISEKKHAFPRLEVFKISGMPCLKEWNEVENGDFPCLNKLIIEQCPKLATFPLLSNFNSLRHLEVSSCPRLFFSPTEGVSHSLQVLLIRDCAVLKEHWKKGEGQDWHNISNKFSLWVDHHEILF